MCIGIMCIGYCVLDECVVNVYQFSLLCTGKQLVLVIHIIHINGINFVYYV